MEFASLSILPVKDGSFNMILARESELKSGLSKLLTVNFLYKLFWLGYCIILPMLYSSFSFPKKVVDKINLPVPPISIGILFFLSWLIFRVSLSYLLPEYKSLQYYSSFKRPGAFCHCGFFGA